MHPHQQLVRQFHETFGLTINDTPTLSPKDDALRINLIQEELDELKEGIANNDRVEIADALADLAYVIYGAGVTYGFILLDPFVMEATIPGMELRLSGIESALRDGSQVAVQCGLESLLEDVNYFAEIHEIPLDAVFTEVHRSNMSKLWTDVEVEITTGDELDGVSEVEHEGNTYTFVGGDSSRLWLVKRADGKVLKSPSYSPADIVGVLARQKNEG